MLLAEARWAIWYCRNLHKFEEKHVNFEYIRQIFVSNLKVCIAADHKRLPKMKFKDLWAYNNVLCKVIEGNLKINI